jgi:hypothetical protein
MNVLCDWSFLMEMELVPDVFLEKHVEARST